MIVVLLNIAGPAPMKEATPRTACRTTSRRYIVDTVDLDFDLREQGTRVTSRLAI